MLLQKTGNYNDISQKLREELTNKINSLGDSVKLRFDISRPNPDPDKHDGLVIWPSLYSLQPAVFTIKDPYEEDKNKSPIKQIALTDGQIDEKNKPTKFFKLQIRATDWGIKEFKPKEKPEDFEQLMYAMLHPKFDGKFKEINSKSVVFLIDDKAQAVKQREERNARKKAMDVAESLDEKGLKEFARALFLDDTKDPDILRNEVEKLAEETPEYFNDLIDNKKVTFRAIAKQAIDKNIISFDPAEWKFTWTNTKQPIVTFQQVANKDHKEQLAEWFEIGDKGKDVFEKIKSLLK